MPDVTSNTTDGYNHSGALASSLGWDNAHDTTGAGNPTTTATNASFFGPRAQFTTFRGGIYFINRCFFDFDLSGVSSGVTAVNFKTVTDTNGGHDAIVLKSGHDPSNASTKWFSTWLTGLGGTLSGWSNSDSQVVAYSSNVSAGMGAGYVDLTLNSDALSDMASLSSFKVVVTNYTNDYLDNSSSTEGVTGVAFSEDGSLSRPKIDYTAGAAGYGHDVIGVTSTNISTVIGIATADIDNVIDVS